MKTLSIVISALNEEKKIGRCLSSVKWADEIIVVDNGSLDATSKIARSLGAKVFKQKNNNMLNVNKNFGFTKACSDWILCLDADEEIPPDLKAEILSVLDTESDACGYWIARKNIIFEKWIQHGLWWPDKQLRLFKRSTGSYPCKHVHEYLSVDGKTSELRLPYIHYNYESISQFIRKMDIYSENEVDYLIRVSYQFSWFDAIRFPVSDFIKIYFAEGGYKDGLHGLVLSLLQSVYSFVVFAKLWEKKGFNEEEIRLDQVEHELTRDGKEIWFWLLTAKILQAKNFFVKKYFQIVKKLLFI
ncbi:glycosyltransferase family 2 protein [Candidatus Gottesmanbacteria bacterium]|nr:glycosyltransferase family 2 protein [Candidatus Gottesmanbacteria bacterium]